MFWKKEAYCNLNLLCRVEILQEKWGSTLKHRSLCDHWVKIILFSESEDWNFTQQFSLLIFILYQRNKKRFLNPTYVHLKLIPVKLKTNPIYMAVFSYLEFEEKWMCSLANRIYRFSIHIFELMWVRLDRKQASNFLQFLMEFKEFTIS